MSVALPVPNEATPAVVNLSGYRFVSLDNLPLLQHDLFQALDAIGIKGTVLLAAEGINLALSGSVDQVAQARECIDRYPELRGIWLKKSYSEHLPFARLKVRQRREIISFLPEQATAPAAGLKPASEFVSEPASEFVSAASTAASVSASDTLAAPVALPGPPAPAMPPATLARWLDERRDFTLLDTRNHYEVASGTFESARHLDISTFREFTAAVEAGLADGRLNIDQPMVTFCTGGIRCEKAAPWLLERGFREVHQLEGGILNYLEQCGGRHWQGDCFVFDDRVELDAGLKPTGASLCSRCQRAIPAGQCCDCSPVPQRGGETSA